MIPGLKICPLGLVQKPNIALEAQYYTGGPVSPPQECEWGRGKCKCKPVGCKQCGPISPQHKGHSTMSREGDLQV